MKGAVALRNPVGTPIINDNSGVNITSGSAVTLDAAADNASSAVMIFNTSTKAITFTATGTVDGVSVTRLFSIPPAAIGQVFPMEIYKGMALKAQASGADATTGFFVVNFLG